MQQASAEYQVRVGGQSSTQMRTDIQDCTHKYLDIQVYKPHTHYHILQTNRWLGDKSGHCS